MKTYRFSIALTVRVIDLNYANHVGYQNFFSFFQEARIAYLKQFDYSEMDIEGHGMIIGEANCRYKQELFLNDQILVACAVTELMSKGFVMEYQISKANTICATGHTKNFCYDYQTKRVIRPPEAFVQAVRDFDGLL
jgi:acyl-CoA thioester hydrolase